MKMRNLLYVTVIWGQMIIRVLTITRGGSVELIIDISIRRFVSLTRLFCCLWSRPPRSGFYVLCAQPYHIYTIKANGHACMLLQKFAHVLANMGGWALITAASIGLQEFNDVAYEICLSLENWQSIISCLCSYAVYSIHVIGLRV